MRGSTAPITFQDTWAGETPRKQIVAIKSLYLLRSADDKNPLKVGMFTPGAHLPVLPVSALNERKPDYVLILAWNFADEIIQQQQEYRDNGGHFIIPIPEPRII